MEGSNPAPRRRTRAAAANGAPAEEGAPEVVEEVGATSFLQRAPLRRRLQYLRRRHEVALRDLGGFVFESHRQGGEQPTLIAEKLAVLSAIDDERERLERALDERREVVALREPGISVCAECSTLHGSEANFCPHCGTAAGSRGRDRKAARG